MTPRPAAAPDDGGRDRRLGRRGRSGALAPVAVVATGLAAGLALGACSAPEAESRGAITPAQMTIYRDGVDDAASVRARHRALPAPSQGRVDVAAGPEALARRLDGDAASPSGPAAVTLRTATDELSFDLLCTGRADVVETVRPMAEAEREVCAAEGLQVVQMEVAAEATVVVVDRAASPDACLTTDELAGMLADPPTVTSWAQLGLDPTPLSARSVGVDVDSRLDWLLGTDQQREEAAALPRRTRTLTAYRDRLARLRAAAPSAGDPGYARRARVRREYDGVVDRYEASVAARSAEDARLGRVAVLPYADYLRHRDRATALAVTSGPAPSGCTLPDAGSISVGDYPLSRPRLLTTTLRSWRRPEVAAYLGAYLRAVPRLARSTGRVPAAGLVELSRRVRDDDPPLPRSADPVEPPTPDLPPPPAP